MQHKWENLLEGGRGQEERREGSGVMEEGAETEMGGLQKSIAFFQTGFLCFPICVQSFL